MTISSSAGNLLLIIFAVIGGFALLAFIAMLFMHGSMMGTTGMMGSLSDMVAGCQSVASKSI